MKYVLFEMNPSPKDSSAYFKFEDVESIKKSIDSIYADMEKNAFTPIQELCSEKQMQVNAYNDMLSFVSNLINNNQDDTDK